MRFYVPIPLPFALFFGLFYGMARVTLWALRMVSRATVQVVRHAIYSIRRSVGMARQAHEQRQAMLRDRRQHKERVDEFVRRVDAVEREVQDYCAERAAGRVIDGECRRLPERIT